MLGKGLIRDTDGMGNKLPILPTVTKFLYEDPGGSVKRGLAMVQKTGKLRLSMVKGPALSPSH